MVLSPCLPFCCKTPISARGVTRTPAPCVPFDRIGCTLLIASTVLFPWPGAAVCSFPPAPVLVHHGGRRWRSAALAPHPEGSVRPACANGDHEGALRGEVCMYARRGVPHFAFCVFEQRGPGRESIREQAAALPRVSSPVCAPKLLRPSPLPLFPRLVFIPPN